MSHSAVRARQLYLKRTLPKTGHDAFADDHNAAR